MTSARARARVTPRGVIWVKQCGIRAREAIAQDLKREGRTQAEIASLFGVDRSTVSLWLGEGTNVNSHNSSLPDSRQKIPKTEAAIPQANVPPFRTVTP